MGRNGGGIKNRDLGKLALGAENFSTTRRGVSRMDTASRSIASGAESNGLMAPSRLTVMNAGPESGQARPLFTAKKVRPGENTEKLENCGRKMVSTVSGEAYFQLSPPP